MSWKVTLVKEQNANNSKGKKSRTQRRSTGERRYKSTHSYNLDIR